MKGSSPQDDITINIYVNISAQIIWNKTDRIESGNRLFNNNSWRLQNSLSVFDKAVKGPVKKQKTWTILYTS